jgi:DNA-binding MarR family transcriptional regulator
MTNGPALPKNPLEQLYRRPGFMLRRAHQIAVALFYEETGALRITTTQFGVLHLLKHQPGLDQITVAKLLGLDRSTTGMVLATLETAALIGRRVGLTDRRRRSLALTPAGERMLRRLKAPARRVAARQLAAFSRSERALFLRLLDKFTRAFNESTRVPLEAPGRSPASAPPATASLRGRRGAPRRASARSPC